MDQRTAEVVVATRPEFRGIERVEPLEAGFSPHRKFLLIEGNAPRFILRFSSIETLDRLRGEFEVLRRLSAQGLTSSSVPVCFGITEDDSACYTGTSYLPGEDAGAVLPKLSAEDQLDLGRAAGVELRKIYRLTPEGAGDWRGKHLRAYALGVRATEAAGISVPGEHLVQTYVEAKKALIETASIGLMHNDFDPRNIIVEGQALRGIIDFEGWDWGDPIHDFRKLAWFTLQTSVPFARGQIEGYWSGSRMPADFWQRYNLHVAMSLHRMLPFIADFDPAQLDDWITRARAIVEDHDLQDGGPPAWFE